jgi:hypothetical protein
MKLFDTRFNFRLVFLFANGSSILLPISKQITLFSGINFAAKLTNVDPVPIANYIYKKRITEISH